MRRIALLLLAVGCSRGPAVTQEEVRQKVKQAIQARKLGGVVRLEGDDLLHNETEGRMRFSLHRGYEVCAKSAKKCDLYIDRVLGVFEDSMEKSDNHH